VGREGRDRILTLQGRLKEDGIKVSIRKLCRILGYHRSNIYYASKTPRSASKPEQRIVEKVRDIIDRYPAYGTRRITWVLRKEEGIAYNRKRIHRIIKMNGWQCIKRPSGYRPRVKGLRSDTPLLNHRWAVDMTHIFTRKDGWCHLIALIDCCDRYLVGWRFTRCGSAGFCAGALEDALLQQHIAPKSTGLIIRSDNGLVFGSKRFHETMTKYGLFQEYITPYTPQQNGMIERFFRSIKEELVWQREFASFDDGYNAIADWIRHYNETRPHMALGYVTPAEVRQKLSA